MSDNLLHPDDSNFEAEVLKSDVPVLVDFWAEWCGPCKMVGPTIEALADKYAGKAKVAKVNVDNSPNTASQYGIMSIPTVAIFKDGQVVEQSIGVQPLEAYEQLLDKTIG